MFWCGSTCPRCGNEVSVGIMSLCATCECGAFYVVTGNVTGWFKSREAYNQGKAQINGEGVAAAESAPPAE